METEMEDFIEDQPFYELMQAYRWARTNSDTVDAFEAVKQFIRENTFHAA